MATISISCGANTGREGHGTPGADTSVPTIRELGYDYDTFTTPKGRTVDIFFIKHGSLVMDIGGYLVYIDPTTIYGNDFAAMPHPKPDMLLVTHSHHDHLDPKADDELITPSTRVLGGGDVPQKDARFTAVVPGDVIADTCAGFTITCTAAYNTTPDHLGYHPKERRDVGFLFDIDGLRIYVAGDTEPIPEMSELDPVDIAFLPVNQPFTMTPAQAIDAAETIKPKILYPYHYGDTDLTPLVNHFKSSPVTEVRVRQLQ